MSWQECVVIVAALGTVVATARFVVPLVFVPATSKAKALEAATAELKQRIDTIEGHLIDRRPTGLPTNLGRRA